MSPVWGLGFLKFPLMVIFWGFLTDDEQTPKLVPAHTRILLDIKNVWWCWMALFVKINKKNLCLWYFKPCRRHGLEYHYVMGKTTLQKVLFYIITQNSTLTLAGALLCFITPPFSYTKMFVKMSPIYGCNYNWKFSFYLLEKLVEGKNIFFSHFVTWMKL